MTPFELAIVLVSAALHALWNTTTKGSPNPVAALLAMEIVGAIGAAAALPFCGLGEIPTPLWWLLGATGLVHGFYAYWLSMGYSRGELSIVYPISRSTPALVPLVAVPLLGESISFTGGAGIAVVVGGIWLMQLGQIPGGGSAGGWRRFVAPGAVYAYLTLAATVGYSLLDKRGMQIMSAFESSALLPRSIIFYVLITLAHVPIFACLASRRVTRAEVVGLLGSRIAIGGAIAGLASYALILEALRTAPVSYVVAGRQMSVVFAVALAVGWLGERIDLPRLLGATATVGGVAIIALYA